MDDRCDPETYERLTGLSKDAYEQALLTAGVESFTATMTVEHSDGMITHQVGCLEHGTIDDVVLVGDEADVELLVTFTLDGTPDCRYGWRTRVWPAPSPDDEMDGTPGARASLLAIHLEEIVVARPGPPPCDPDVDGITWVR